MSIRRVHNPIAAVVPHNVAELGLSLEALGLYLFVQCQPDEISSAMLAEQFRTTEKEIDALLSVLIAHDLLDVVEAA